MCFPGGSGFLILANRALKKIFAVHDFAFKKGPLHSLDAKPVGYSGRYFSYHKGTPPDCLNKKTAYPSRHTDHLKMLGP